MFRCILVPLDGTPNSECMIPVAARIAHACHGSVILLRVVDRAATWWPANLSGPTLARTAVEDDLAEADHYLHTLSQSSVLQGLSVEAVALFGPVALTILTAAQTYGCDLILLCRHEEGSTHWMTNSAIVHVAQHTSIPVLVLHESGSLLDDPHSLRALVPLNGTAHELVVLRPAMRLVTSLVSPAQGTLHLTQVIAHRVAQTSNEACVRVVHDARAYLGRTMQRLHEQSEREQETGGKPLVTCSIIYGDDVAETLHHVATYGEVAEKSVAESWCTFIVMAVYGDEHPSHQLPMRMVERILNGTTLSVFIVRSAKDQDQEDTAPCTDAPALV